MHILLLCAFLCSKFVFVFVCIYSTLYTEFVYFVLFLFCCSHVFNVIFVQVYELLLVIVCKLNYRGYNIVVNYIFYILCIIYICTVIIVRDCEMFILHVLCL